MGTKSVEADIARAAEQIILKDFKRKISTQELAASLYVGERTLTRAFKKTYGMNLHEYQLQIRMEKAKEYLEDHKPVSEVATLVGYKRHSSFTKQFIKIFGKPPSSWNN